MSVGPSPLKSPVAANVDDRRGLAVVHQPGDDMAVIVAEQNVGASVAIEIAGALDVRRGRRRASRLDGCEIAALYRPGYHLACFVAEQDIVRMIAIEVAGAADVPSRVDRSDVPGGGDLI